MTDPNYETPVYGGFAEHPEDEGCEVEYEVVGGVVGVVGDPDPSLTVLQACLDAWDADRAYESMVTDQD